MIIHKLLGYCVAGIGVLILIIWSIESFRTKVYTILPESILPTYLLIGGLIMSVLGVLIVSMHKKGTKKVKEVPIYQGQHIVGYRRH